MPLRTYWIRNVKKKHTCRTSNNRPTSKGLLFVERKSFLPPPNELERYEALHPGITDRLLTSYEKQQTTVWSWKKRSSSQERNNHARANLCIYFRCDNNHRRAFSSIKDKNVQGYTLIVGSAATLAGVLI